MHFLIDTEKTWCFQYLMFQMHPASSVLCGYREAGCTEELVATVQYHLLKIKTSPIFCLENHLLGKRG